jgi:hypothetical protein
MGGPTATAAARPLEWIGDAAPTTVTAKPSGGAPPAAMALAQVRRTTDPTKSAYSPTVWTKTPRTPELPPDARHRYSPHSSRGSPVVAARVCSTAGRESRWSVTIPSKLAIICALVMTGSRARSSSSKRWMSIPASRSA